MAAPYENRQASVPRKERPPLEALEPQPEADAELARDRHVRAGRTLRVERDAEVRAARELGRQPEGVLGAAVVRGDGRVEADERLLVEGVPQLGLDERPRALVERHLVVERE